MDVLNMEIPSHESIQVDSPRNSIPAQYADVFFLNAELPAEIFVDLPGKECDLPLIVVFVVKESIPTQAAPGDTLD